jgi:MFS family permease
MSRDRRGIVGLLTSVGVSLLGTRMSFVAIPWFVLATTHSPTRTGLVAFAEMTPYVMVQAMGGPVVDRVGARRISVLTDMIAALCFGTVPVLHVLGDLSLPLLATLVAVGGSCRGAGDAARDVLVPGVGELAVVGLERSSGLYDGVSRLASLIGAPIAGVLIAVTSATSVLAIDAGTFLISAVVVRWLVPLSAQPPPAPADDGDITNPSYFTSLAEGFRYLRGDRLLLGIAAMVAVTNLVDQAGGAVMTPVWAIQVAHSSVALGLIGGAFGIGAVAGNALSTWLGSRMPRRLTYGIGFLLCGAPRFVVLAVAATVSPVLIVMVISGLGAGGINPILGAVEYSRVPRHLQARVLGAVGATAWVGIPVGSLAGGALVSGIGLRGALLSAAVLYGVTTLAPFVFPVWREMDQELGHGTEEGEGGEGVLGTAVVRVVNDLDELPVGLVVGDPR